MKNIRWSQLNIILAIVVGIMIILTIILGIGSYTERELFTVQDVENLNSAWIVATDGDYDVATDLPCNLEVDKGDYISITRYIPDEVQGDYGIAFYSIYNEVQVLVGGTLIYDYGSDVKHPFLRSPAPNWNFVPIDRRYAGQVITITLRSEYGRYSGLFAEIQAGSRSAILYHVWMTYGIAIICSLLLIIFGIGLCVILFMLKLQKRLDFRVWYFLILVAASTVYIVTGNPLLMVYTQNVYLLWLVHTLLRMIVPVAYLMFLRGFVQKKRLTMAVDGGIILTSIIYIVVLILQGLKLVELPFMYDVLGVIYKLLFVAYTVLFLIGYLKYHMSEMRTIMIANVLLCIAGIVNEFVRPNHLYQQMGAFWQICATVYLFLLLGAVLEVVFKQVDQKVQNIEDEYSSQRALAVAMMNPNFLFATLSSLLTMIKEESRSSAKLVFAFSKYLRYNLDSIREDKMVTFEEELNHIISYLEIQQLRIPELEVVIEDKLHDFNVPMRSIESIVENAVKHGIEKRGNKGQVIVRSYERRDSYAIQIVDDGIGFDTDRLYIKNTPTSMKMVRSRLEDSIQASIDVNSRPDKGTIVTIKIPKLKKQEMNDNNIVNE